MARIVKKMTIDGNAYDALTGAYCLQFFDSSSHASLRDGLTTSGVDTVTKSPDVFFNTSENFFGGDAFFTTSFVSSARAEAAGAAVVSWSAVVKQGTANGDVGLGPSDLTVAIPAESNPQIGGALDLGGSASFVGPTVSDRYRDADHPSDSFFDATATLWAIENAESSQAQISSEPAPDVIMMCGCPACLAARSHDSAAIKNLGEDDNAVTSPPAADTVGAPVVPDPQGITNYVDALVNEYDYQWGSYSPGTSAVVTYSFLTSVPGYYSAGADERTNFAPMNATQQAAVREILQLYSAAANITFVEVAGVGSITFATADLGSGIAGWAYYPYPGYSGSSDGGLFGDVWITNRYASYANPIKGTWEYNAFIHEIGHAIGLKHPGNYNAGGGGTGGPYLPSAEDNHQYTVMSYYSGPSYGGKEPITPQLYDVAAIQYLYGANTSYHAGNDTYTFSTSVQVKTIWDGDGSDTFDASNQLAAVNIDLHSGSFSSIAGSNNVAIAYGAVIEAAVGSNYNDTLKASNSGSGLYGGGGADTLIGGAGNDTIAGGSSADMLTGQAGADTFVFDDGHTGATVGSRDVITDFTIGTDKLDLAAVDADSHTGADDAFRFLGTAALDGQSGALHFFYDASRGVTVLEGDTNGDVVADFAIDLTGNKSLTNSDFSSGSLAVIVPLVLTGTGAADTLVGGLADDTLSGLGGSDTLIGSGGNDYLDGGAAADTMIGGTGNDTYLVDNAGDVVTEVTSAGLVVPAGWTLKGVADFDGDGEIDVVVTNGTSANQLWILQNGIATAQHDLAWIPGWTLLGIGDLNGDGNKDLLFSQNSQPSTQYEVDLQGWTQPHAGAFVSGKTVDALTGFPVPAGWTLKGTADFDGDGEIDIVVTNGTSTNQVWLLKNGNVASQHNLAWIPGYTLLGIRDFNGDGNKDLLFSQNGQLSTQYEVDLQGWTQPHAGAFVTGMTVDAVMAMPPVNQGIDIVQAAVGYTLPNGVENLTLVGGAGAIDGTGNAAANSIIGNEVANRIGGMGGADTLTGGAGADTFVFDDGDTGATVGSRDVITDFAPGADKLDLAAIDADDRSVMDDAFRFLGTAAFDGQAGALHYFYDAGRGMTVLEGDTNGDGIADFAIDLSGNDTLAVSDFTTGSLLLPIINPPATGGVDSLTGSALDDILSGLGGNDTLYGYAGNDTLDGGTGADTMVGGTGNDAYVVDNAGDAVTEVTSAGFVVPPGWMLKGAADFDGDGETDIVVTNGTSVNQLWILQNGSVMAQHDLAWIPGWTLLGTGDLNGDGSKDLLFGLNGQPSTQYEVDLQGWTQPHAGSFVSGKTVDAMAGFPVPAGWTLKGTADFDGDGETDIVVTNGTSANQLWILQNGSVASQYGLAWIPGWTLLGIGDLNGDGSKDLLFNLNGQPSTQYEVDLQGWTQPHAGSFVSGKTVDAVMALPPVNQGIDTVQASISYTLPNGVENLTLVSGAGAIDGTGNTAANSIIGNEAANRISGMGGADTLTGGGGADIFVFEPNFGKDTIADFHHGEDVIEIDHSIFASFADLAAHSALDGNGNIIVTASAADVIKFVGISSLFASDFHIV